MHLSFFPSTSIENEMEVEEDEDEAPFPPPLLPHQQNELGRRRKTVLQIEMVAQRERPPKRVRVPTTKYSQHPISCCSENFLTE